MAKKIIGLVLLSVILVAAVGVVYYFYDLNQPNSNNTSVQRFVVPEGFGSQKISQALKQAGLINNDIVFELYVWTHGISSKLQPGQYDLASNLSIVQIAKILSHSKAGLHKEEVNLTFIEGWNNSDFARYLAKNNIVSEDDFFAAVQKKADWWDSYDFLASKPKNLDLEGYLFPDTYRIYRDATVSDIIKKILDNFGNKLTPQMREEISRQGKTIHEIITMAAIVEKEVSTDSDRKMVADIFWRRLKIGMALQSDATVNYATGQSTTRPSLADISIDSLYNTYKYKGLPPGPICNPGISAILAVIYPTPNKYYYFLTTPQGQAIYSKTLQEHNAAKAKYLER